MVLFLINRKVQVASLEREATLNKHFQEVNLNFCSLFLCLFNVEFYDGNSERQNYLWHLLIDEGEVYVSTLDPG